MAAAVSRAYRDRGIVLRTHRLGETDRIVTFLLEGRGKVRAVAKGVRRPGSRIGARLEPFSHVDLELHEGRSLDIVRQVESIDTNEALRRDDEFTFVSAWECNGKPSDANLHKEELVYENIELKQRSYK